MLTQRTPRLDKVKSRNDNSIADCHAKPTACLTMTESVWIATAFFQNSRNDGADERLHAKMPESRKDSPALQRGVSTQFYSLSQWQNTA